MRLNKYLAHSGIASRRKAAEIIKSGKVYVNGKIVNHPAYEVKSGDIVKYKGKILKPEENKVYLLLNKPKNTITSLKDERGRKTVIDLIRDDIQERIFPVGRLDYKTTGLLLLTNDGNLAKKLSHPRYKVPKVYQVTLDKNIDKRHYEQIKKGLQLHDGIAYVDWIKVMDGKGFVLNLEIHIGKNRIVRRIFEHFGYKVKKLDRIYYAGLTKKGLKRGSYRHLTEKEIIMLKHFT